jgi:predicted nucleic acid-binding protein
MKLVIDTNEIFSFFNAKSKSREIALRPDIELFSPSFAITEIEKHKEDILERFGLSGTQYSIITRLLKTIIKFIGEEEYSEVIGKAKKVSPDPNDADFFALAMKKNCPIWSEDKLLKGQESVEIYTTSDFLKLLEWIE